MEIAATLYWTPGFLEKFETARGYSLLRHLPTLFQPSNVWGSVAPSYSEIFISQNSTAVNLDYRTTLNEGYQDYLRYIEQWSKQIGVRGFSAQPAYNLPLDMVVLSSCCMYDHRHANALTVGRCASTHCTGIRISWIRQQH